MSQKMRHCYSSQNAHKTLFQSTVDIHFQNVHETQKNAKASTLCVYFLKVSKIPESVRFLLDVYKESP